MNNRDPENGIYGGFVGFSEFGDDNGLGVAVGSSYVCLVTDKNRLLVGQYRQIQSNLGFPRINNVPTEIECGSYGISCKCSDDATKICNTY